MGEFAAFVEALFTEKVLYADEKRKAMDRAVDLELDAATAGIVIAETLKRTGAWETALSAPVSPLAGFSPIGNATDPVSGHPLRIRHNELNYALVRIPAGNFMMGSYDSYWTKEKVRTEVYLDAYYMGVTPVTNAQFREFESAHDSGNDFNDDGQPAVRVDHSSAVRFALKYRMVLPTEAQWERAAAGIEGRRYPWGDEEPTPQRANFGRSIGHSSPVSGHPSGATPEGILDMAGNVWEWCSDWYGGEYYRNSPLRNPRGPTIGTHRVVRGGSWSDNSDRLRAAYCGGFEPTV